MRRKLWFLLPVTIVFLCVLGLPAASRSSLGISRGRCVISSSQYLLIADNSPIVLSDCSRSGNVLAGLSPGDELLVLHDGVQETYPAHTGAYAVWTLRRGSIEDVPFSALEGLLALGWEIEGIEQLEPPACPLVSFPTAVSWANYGNADLLWAQALNSETAADSSIHHLPILQLDSRSALDTFVQEIAGTFTTQQGYDEVPSFEAVIAGMDEVFFSENSLFLLYVPADSCSWRYDVNRIDLENGHFCVHVQRTDSLESGDCAMAGWFITVSVPKAQLAGITTFDADLGNLME